MPDVKEKPSRIPAKPGYWDWWRYLVNDWAPPAKVDKASMIAFLAALVIDATDGIACYPHNETIMRKLCKSRRWVQQYRKAAVRCGLVRPTETGQRYKNRVRVLEISLPSDRKVQPTAPYKVQPTAPITNEDNQLDTTLTNDVRNVQHTAPYENPPYGDEKSSAAVYSSAAASEPVRARLDSDDDFSDWADLDCATCLGSGHTVSDYGYRLRCECASYDAYTSRRNTAAPVDGGHCPKCLDNGMCLNGETNEWEPCPDGCKVSE